MRTPRSAYEFAAFSLLEAAARAGRAMLTYGIKKNYIGNSRKSLRLSLPLVEKLRLFGRTCRIPPFG